MLLAGDTRRLDAGGWATARNSAPALSARRWSMSQRKSPPANCEPTKPTTTSPAEYGRYRADR